jgi:hypothetical protein
MKRIAIIFAALVACKHEPDADFTKRTLVEQTVKVSSVGRSVNVRVKVPEGLKPTISPSFFQPDDIANGPQIHVELRLESSSPKTPEEALRFNDQRALSYKSHDLGDGFVVTNTPNGEDTNYYTVAVRRFPSLPKSSANQNLVIQCSVDYLGARTLKREKAVVAWMESICTDLTLAP